MIEGLVTKVALRRNLKEKALRLRSKGLSYNDILKKIPVTKSTISLWCRYVILTPEQEGKLKEKSKKSGLDGIKAIQTMFWQRRCQAFLEGVALSQKLGAKDPELFAGLMLYWAEGTKKVVQLLPILIPE